MHAVAKAIYMQGRGAGREAMKRSNEVWVHVGSEGRLLKEAVREAMKFGGRVQWVKDLRMGLEAFGWQGLDMQAFSGLSLSEVKHILKCTAWRRAWERVEGRS